MKAPDKIKIVRFSDTAELSDYWVLENRTKNEDIEYIRKDTLLELLEQKRIAVIDCSATDKRKVAALSVIDFLIDKIELL